MMWIKTHPAIVNLLLAFLIAICASAWVNYFTSATLKEPMTDRKNAFLVIAIILLGVQCWINLSASHIEQRVIEEVLDLGRRFFVAHSNQPADLSDFRALVLLKETTRPGKKLPPQRCLVPRYWKSPVRPRDYGAIPIDAESFMKWYVNVKAFHEQRVICQEPVESQRPPADGHYVSTPSLFEGKTVIATPVWSNREPPTVIGTVTFDSKLSMSELDWCINGKINESVKEMMDATANLIGNILSNNQHA